MAQTFGAEAVRCARTIARLLTQRRKLRRQLKRIGQELAIERKHLKALEASIDREPDTVPSRVFGDGVGHKWRKGPKKP